MILFSLTVLIAYTLLIGLFVVGFLRHKKFKNTLENPNTSFSIIIPFRNEQDNLPLLLKSISALNYPYDKFEVILVNDASEDNFKKIIDNFSLKHKAIDLSIIDNQRKSNSPKKDAIETAIGYAKFNWIITTDADCIVPKHWLKVYNSFVIKNNPYFIAGPVLYKNITSVLDHFQSLDLAAIIGSTIGGFGINKPFMCNGANLAYRKDIFKEVNGFSNHNHLATGDDIFLLESIYKNFPKKVFYLNSILTTTQTKTESSLSKLISQRIRWASKSPYYNNHFSKIIGGIIFLGNLFFVILFILAFLFSIQSLLISVLLFSKIIVDICLIGLTLKWQQNLKSLLYYPLLIPLQPFFYIFIGIASIFSNKYEWKGRVFNIKKE